MDLLNDLAPARADGLENPECGVEGAHRPTGRNRSAL